MATVYVALTWEGGGKGGTPAPEGVEKKDEAGPEPAAGGGGKETGTPGGGAETKAPEKTEEPPSGVGEARVKKEETSPAGLEIPVRFGEPRRTREKLYSLMELIKKSDVILAGRFTRGGHDNSFVVEEVLKGNRAGGVEKLLTDNGMICPGSANPRMGQWAVAFGKIKKGAVTIHSGQWLKQFRTEPKWRAFVEKVRSYMGDSIVPRLTKELGAAARAEARGGEKDDTPSRANMEEMAELMRVMKEIMERVGNQGPQKIREELEKWLATKSPETRERIRNMMDGKGGGGGRAPRGASLDDLIKDLEKKGNLEAMAGLMHVYVDVPPSTRGARMLLALGSMKLGGGSSRLDRAGEIEQMKKRLEKLKGLVDEEKLKDLMKKLLEVEARGGGGEPGGGAGEPLEGLDDARITWVATTLSATCTILGFAPSAPLEMDEMALRGAVLEIREALLRRAATDPASPAEHRTCALKAMIRCAPDALAREELTEILMDGTRMHPTRLHTIMLCASRKVVEAVPSLLSILRNVPTEGNGPAPGKSYFHGTVSGFSLKVEAIKALGALGDGSAIPELMALLKETPVPGSSMRAWIAGALADLNATEAVPVLESLLAETTDRIDRNGMERALERLKK
jgi:hypothetical protein